MTTESSAVSSQGAHIEVDAGTLGTPVVATAITAANPPVATKTTHGLVAGDVADISSITQSGWDTAGIEGFTFPVKKLTTDTFSPIGADSTGLTPATDGTFTPHNFVALCEAKTFQGFDGQATEIDVTTLCSAAKEYRLGLQDFGSFSFDMNLVPNDAAQLVLEAAKADMAARWFRLYVPDGTGPGNYQGVFVFKAFVRQKTIAGGVDAAMTSQVTLRITGAPVYIEYI